MALFAPRGIDLVICGEDGTGEVSRYMIQQLVQNQKEFPVPTSTPYLKYVRCRGGRNYFSWGILGVNLVLG